jgi:HEAT repeat protein
MQRKQVMYSKILIVFLPLAALVLASGPSRDYNELIGGLLSDDPFTREHAQRELLAAKDDHGIMHAVAGVLTNTPAPRNNDSVERAIFILGQIRTPESIDLLIRYISFPFDAQHLNQTASLPPRGTGIGSRIKYPAVDALTQIGEPCLARVIAKLGSADGFDRQACHAVLEVLKEKAPVVEMLKTAAAKETDEKKRARLQASLQDLTKNR